MYSLENFVPSNRFSEDGNNSIDSVELCSFQILSEDEPEKYQSHFSEYIKGGIEPDNMEELYKKVHAAIRADPTPVQSAKQPPMEHKR